MSLQFSRAFKDISLSFVRNPITDDILTLQNEDAIKKSVKNLVLTILGERFFNSLIGTSLSSSLFELNLEEISATLQDTIAEVLENFEPRIRLKDVNYNFTPDSNDVEIEVSYDIVGFPFPTQTIQFLLQPSRL